jgi:DNA-binding response OmpR family regulator
MLTARAQDAEKVLGLDLGADDYVTKPFSPRELRARIRAALRRTAAEAADVHRFGDLELDLSRCELRQNGKVVEVTPIEFKLLSAFVRNRGRVVSRQKLLDEGWGAGTFLNDRVIDNHIVSLRRKIEVDAGNPRYLVSIRGVGYRFDG